MESINHIVKFPFPDWSELTDDDQKLAKLPSCYCWMWKDEEGDLVYGFDNDVARDFLSNLFGKFVSFDNNSVKEFAADKIPAKGVFFYEKNNDIDEIKKSVMDYFILEKKREIMTKRGFNEKPCQDRLEFIPLQRNDVVLSKSINYCVQRNLPFVLTRFFMPEAGDIFITFNESLEKNIERLARCADIKYVILDDINELPTPAW